MAITNAIENFEMTVHAAFVNKAVSLVPKLIETTVKPVRTVNIVPNGGDFSARNNDLVKRCLYLFTGLTQNEGRVAG